MSRSTLVNVVTVLTVLALWSHCTSAQLNETLVNNSSDTVGQLSNETATSKYNFNVTFPVTVQENITLPVDLGVTFTGVNVTTTAEPFAPSEPLYNNNVLRIVILVAIVGALLALVILLLFKYFFKHCKHIRTYGLVNSDEPSVLHDIKPDSPIYTEQQDPGNIVMINKKPIEDV